MVVSISDSDSRGDSEDEHLKGSRNSLRCQVLPEKPTLGWFREAWRQLVGQRVDNGEDDSDKLRELAIRV